MCPDFFKSPITCFAMVAQDLCFDLCGVGECLAKPLLPAQGTEQVYELNSQEK